MTSLALLAIDRQTLTLKDPSPDVVGGVTKGHLAKFAAHY